MKKLNILLLTTLFVFTLSCSKDNDDIRSDEAGIHKVTFEQSGAYEDYDVVASGNAIFGVQSIDSNGEQTQTVASFLTDSFYSMQSKEKSVFFTFIVAGESQSEATESMYTKITMYFNDEVVHTETIEFLPGDQSRNYLYIYDVRMNPKLTTPAK